MTQQLVEAQPTAALERRATVQPLPPGQEPGGLPLRKLCAALFRARMFLATLTTLGLLAGAFLAITTPNSYVSEGKFLFATTGSETINLDPTRASETEVGTIASRAEHVLTAERLLRRVVARVTPEVVLAPYAPKDEEASGFGAVLHRVQRDWNAADVSEATVEDALLAMRKQLNISRPRGTDVLIATYVAHDRELAQRILAAYMDEAPRFHQEQYDSPKVYEEIKRGAQNADLARASAERSLREFLEQEVRIQSGFEFELEARRQRESDSGAEYDKNLRDVESFRLQLTKLEELQAKTSPHHQVRRQRDISDIVTELWGRISDLDRDLLLTGNEQTRRSLQAQQAQLRQRIEDVQQEAQNAPSVLVVEPNPDFVRQQTEIAAMRTELLKATAVTEKLEQDHATDAKVLGRLLDLEPRYRQLNEDVLRCQEAQSQAAAALAAAETKRQLQAANFSSLKVIEDASLPLEKEGPNRLQLLLGGLAVGMFLSLGLVVVRTLPDTIVREPADLEQLDGVEVLGVIPRLDGRNVRRHESVRSRGC
jgi:uncharacterized protein involved in exopolysaccharide biosynthesis